MVFLDFVIYGFFSLEVSTFRRPQIFTFLWDKPIFLYIIITLFMGKRIWEFGGKSAEIAERES